jgi:ubiquinone/menaquinone biosynthesis C-methylase UbiE
VAVDISMTAIKRAKEKVYHSLNKITFLVGDIYKLNFRRNSFDLINALESLGYTENKKAELEKWINWLTPGGYLLFSGPNLKNYYSYNEIINLFNIPGIEIVEIIPVTSKFPIQYLINRRILPQKDIFWKINMLLPSIYPRFFAKHISILVKKK